MADYNLKSISADTDGPSADTELLFGSPDQSSGTPKPYSFAGIKIWIKSWFGTQSPGYKSGNWYFPTGYGTQSGSALGTTTLALLPFMVSKPVTVSQLAARVGTAVAASNFQLGIYASNPSTLFATGNPLNKTSDISAASSANVGGALGANVSLVPETLYYFGAMISNGGVALAGVSIAAPPHATLVGTATLANLWAGSGIGLSGHTVSGQTYGTWPDLTSASFTDASSSAVIPIVAFKVA